MRILAPAAFYHHLLGSIYALLHSAGLGSSQRSSRRIVPAAQQRVKTPAPFEMQPISAIYARDLNDGLSSFLYAFHVQSAAHPHLDLSAAIGPSLPIKGLAKWAMTLY
ncbi:hypothetical protein PG989_002223 [Apiospora arundinis]